MSDGRGEARHAFLFPGQGAQAMGMGVELADALPVARAVFDRGREVLGLDVLSICRDGPREELDSTRISQPAIFLHSMAVLEAIGEKAGCGAETFGTRLPATATAGLSLGEYSALVFAGALSFEEALRLVGRRGQFMQEACDAASGAMVSVLGLPAAEVEGVVDKARAEGFDVSLANYNSPVQTVVSGQEAAVEEVAERLRTAGARRTVPLRVAGAYHSPLMATATARMRGLIEAAEIRAPRLPFYQNRSGDRVEDPEDIRRGLIEQIESPVRWSQLVQAMVRDGVRSALEIGPGKVLQGLVRGVDRSVPVTPIGDLEALDKSEVLPL